MGATRSRRCNSLDRPGNGMAISESSESLPVMAVTAAPGPSVMMTTASAPSVVVTTPAAAHVAVAMPVAAPDLDQSAVHRRRGRYAQPGGSRYGHGQRSNQCGSNQDDASHQIFSRSRDCDVRHKRAGERLFRPAERNNGAWTRRALEVCPWQPGAKFSNIVFGKNRQNALSLADGGRNQWLTGISWISPAPGRGASIA